MKVVYSRHSLISLKNILSKVGKTTTVSNLILKLEQLLVVNNASDCTVCKTQNLLERTAEGDQNLSLSY